MGRTSQELLLVVQTVPLDGGQLQLVLLDDLLQSRVQILLLLLQELLFLDDVEQRNELWNKRQRDEQNRKNVGQTKTSIS